MEEDRREVATTEYPWSTGSACQREPRQAWLTTSEIQQRSIEVSRLEAETPPAAVRLRRVIVERGMSFEGPPDVAAARTGTHTGPILPGSHGSKDVEGVDPSAETGMVPYKEYQRLEKKYNLLLQEHNELDVAYRKCRKQGKVYKTYADKAMAKYREIKTKHTHAKSDCASWGAFADKLIDLARIQKSQRMDEPVDMEELPSVYPERQHDHRSSTSERLKCPQTSPSLRPTLPPNLALPPQNHAYGDDYVDYSRVEIDQLGDTTTTRDDVLQCEPSIDHSGDKMAKSTIYLRANEEVKDLNDAHEKTPRAEQDHIHDLLEPYVDTRGLLHEKSQHANDAEKQVSSQTTDCGAEPLMSSMPNPTDRHIIDDDVPELVSFRTLKRKRVSTEPYNDPAGRKGAGVGNRGYVRVKHENSHSSPVGLVALARPHDENLDLDEIPGYVKTPRKQHLRRMFSNASRYYEQVRRDRASSEPLDLEEMPHHLSASFELEIEHHSSGNHEGIDGRGSVKINHESSAPSSPALPPQRMMPKDSRNATSFMDRIQGQAALHPLSTNTRLLPQTSDIKARSKTRTRKGPYRLGELSEDGDQYERRETAGDDSVDHTLIHQARPVGGRIQNLLENPTPGKAPLKSPRPALRTPVMHSIARPAALDSTGRHSLATRLESGLQPTPRRAAANTPATVIRRTGKSLLQSLEEYETRPEDEPLRAKHVDRLSLDSFRVNPEANDGYDFAYNEVVRNHDQRKCLPGCTRPACCGDRFKRMVEAGGALPTPSRGLWDSSDNDNADDADQRLLEAYLGENARGRLQRLGEAERRDLLVKAKGEELAQRHGRHRQTFQRSTTPPGFWRTDMPTTQECEEDRQAARKLEREKVEERYREAMRPGGRWLFRDE